jgi:hypothetical protein
VTRTVLPTRAVVAALAFAAAGVVGVLLSPQPWPAKSANAVFYAVLVFNTFFSIRFFDALPPRDRDERVIDGILAVSYLALAASIGAPLWFALLSTALFTAAVAKYALLFGVIDRTALLRRKIRIDGLGLVLCAATAIGSVWNPAASAWVQAVVFAVANVYFLAIDPMYADIPDASAPKKEARQAAPPR